MAIKQKKLSVGDIVFNTLIITILSLYSLIMVFMLVWGLITSLKSSVEFSLIGNVIGFPTLEWSSEELKLGNYLLAFEKFEVSADARFYIGNTLVNHSTVSTMGTMFLNTIIYVGIGCLLPTFVSFLVAYLCAKYRFKLSAFVYGFALFMMSVPTIGTQPAEITLLRSLGVYDTYFCHVFQKFNFSGMYFFVFYAFFETLPDAYAEAAEIDGASQYGVFFTIIIPLGIKLIGSVI